MRDSEYLYGTSYDAKTLKTMMYPEALLMKNVWGKQLTDMLLEYPVQDRDFVRLNKVQEAIRHNTSLYDEMFFKDNK